MAKIDVMKLLKVLDDIRADIVAIKQNSAQITTINQNLVILDQKLFGKALKKVYTELMANKKDTEKLLERVEKLESLFTLKMVKFEKTVNQIQENFKEITAILRKSVKEEMGVQFDILGEKISEFHVILTELEEKLHSIKEEMISYFVSFKGELVEEG